MGKGTTTLGYTISHTESNARRHSYSHWVFDSNTGLQSYLLVIYWKCLNDNLFSLCFCFSCSPNSRMCLPFGGNLQPLCAEFRNLSIIHVITEYAIVFLYYDIEHFLVIFWFHYWMATGNEGRKKRGITCSLSPSWVWTRDAVIHGWWLNFNLQDNLP